MARFKGRLSKREEALQRQELIEQEVERDMAQETEPEMEQETPPWEEDAPSGFAQEENAQQEETQVRGSTEEVQVRGGAEQTDNDAPHRSAPKAVLTGLAALAGHRRKQKNGRKKRGGKPAKKQKIFRAAVVLVMITSAAAAARYFLAGTKPSGAEADIQRTAMVSRGSIVSSLSSSGTLSPKDTYNITSLVSGEVISADFEEGDQVTKGQVLYIIDASSMESELKSAENSLERARSSYERAVADYQKAVNDYSKDTYKATESGYIKTLYIRAGDKVSGETKLADIYDDRTMKLRVPFLSPEAAAIGVGNGGVITLADTGEQIGGTVTSVGNMEESLAGGRLVRYVTLQVENPGGLNTSMSATVQIGDFFCAGSGCFEASLDTVMSADISGSVEVESVYVNEGDYIGKGGTLFKMTSKSAEDLLRTYEDAMDKAEESMESAQNKLDSTQDSYENYTITAPISGTVITKTVKAGDKVQSGGNSTTTLATIYDLSQLTFEMSVDELDVQNVAVGQTVEVAADAFEGKNFTGRVTNVSLASSYSNGVTNYPVTVTMDEVGELLPGMNVDGNIILDQAEDVMLVPVDALMRGNRVYVKDDSVREGQGNVPAGFRAVEVETGLMNDDFVEIVSGLSEGEEVYVAESSVSSDMWMPGGMNGGPMGGPGGGNMGGPGGGGPGGGGRP